MGQGEPFRGGRLRGRRAWDLPRVCVSWRGRHARRSCSCRRHRRGAHRRRSCATALSCISAKLWAGAVARGPRRARSRCRCGCDGRGFDCSRCSEGWRWQFLRAARVFVPGRRGGQPPARAPGVLPVPAADRRASRQRAPQLGRPARLSRRGSARGPRRVLFCDSSVERPALVWRGRGAPPWRRRGDY